jgi:hypothetical protein
MQVVKQEGTYKILYDQGRDFRMVLMCVHSKRGLLGTLFIDGIG